MVKSLVLASSWVFGGFSAALVLSALIAPWVGWVIDAKGGRVVLTASNLVLGLPINRFLLPAAPPPERPATSTLDTGPPPPPFAMPLLAVVFATTWFVAGAMAAHLPVP